jgi:hypothetical protein
LASGRPIIIVEHHTVFQNGYETMTDFVDWVNGLGNVMWKPLSYIVDYYCGKTTNILPCGKSNEATTSVWNEKNIALRRFACEFRDNYVETSRLLTKFYRIVRGMVTRSTD